MEPKKGSPDWTKRLLARLKAPKCKACEGIGVSSRGGICYPCQGSGRKRT